MELSTEIFNQLKLEETLPNPVALDITEGV